MADKCHWSPMTSCWLCLYLLLCFCGMASPSTLQSQNVSLDLHDDVAGEMNQYEFSTLAQNNDMYPDEIDVDDYQMSGTDLNLETDDPVERAKRDVPKLPPLERIISNYYWRDPKASDESYACTTMKSLQLMPGLPKEIGLDLELNIRFDKLDRDPKDRMFFHLSDSYTCAADSRGCSPFTTISLQSCVDTNKFNVMCLYAYGTTNNEIRQNRYMHRGGKLLVRMRDNQIRCIKSGSDLSWDMYNKSTFKFPLIYRSLFLAINHRLFRPWYPVNVARGFGICAVNVTWIRTKPAPSERIDTDYDWSDTNIEDGCKMTTVLNLNPPRPDAEGVVIEMDLLKSNGWSFHIAGAYCNNGGGGGDDAAEMYVTFDNTLHISGRDNLRYVSKANCITGGVARFTLRNNEVKVEMGDSVVVHLKEVALFQFPLRPDGMYFGMNRAVRYPHTGSGLCALKIRWLLPDGTGTEN